MERRRLNTSKMTTTVMMITTTRTTTTPTIRPITEVLHTTQNILVFINYHSIRL